MDYPVRYGRAPTRHPRPQTFQRQWTFDTDQLDQGTVSLNIEANFHPRSPRHKTVSIQDGDSLDTTSQEIERQSARIQREMERERRARSVSPVRNIMTSPATLPPRPARSATPARLQQSHAMVSHSGHTSEMDHDPLSISNLGFHIENADKMILGQELKTLRGALFTTKLQLKEAEKEAREMREKAEEARSELMLLEFKRTTASKDFHRLMDDIERKRALTHSYDADIENKRAQLRDFESIGISKEQAKTLHDENTSLRMRQRSLDAIELERDELARQLEAAKEDLLREQKQARLQREEMREEMETLTARLEETQNGWAAAQQQLQKMDVAFRRMEREKNELIQEKTQEYNAFKTMARQESKENRQLLSREVDVLNSELQQLQVRVADLQADNIAKDDHNIKLKEEIIALQSQLAQEQAARHAVTEEHRKTLQMLRKETDSAMLQLRESLFLEKQKEIEDLRAELEQERRQSSSRSDERMAQMLAENAELISEKNQELVRLQDKLRVLHDQQHHAERRMQDKIDQQVREAVARERAALESENQWKLRSERESVARDAKQRINEMQVTLDNERDTNQRLSREIAQLKEELEEQRRLSREAAKEKLVAVARAKEQVREQTSLEAEQAREKIKQELQRELDRVTSQLKEREEEVRALRAEKQQMLSRERDNLSALDRTEKTVINELNEECRRSASVLGVSPRQVQFSTVIDSSASRPQITTALANLRAVNEELRNHIQELSSELDSCRAMITTLEKDKEESLENIKLEMEKKRTLELEKLKEKLIRLEVDALDLSRTEAQFPQYRPSPNASFRLDLSESRDSEDMGNEHTEELAKVAQASARQSLANSMVGALRRKDTEIEELKAALSTQRQQDAEKYANVYKSELQRELEKSQALLLHSSREQKRINDAQQREIDRLEREVQRLAMLHSNKDSSSHIPSSSLSPKPQQQQQQYLHQRIKQLQAENNALRRKHHLSKNNMSVPDLSASSLALHIPQRPLSPTRDTSEKLRKLEERLRLGEKEALMAEERAKLNSSAMSQKMAEMNKLQNTLSNQNQELHRLEQAYSQLHRQYNQSPVLSAAHILNTTF